MVWVVNWLNLLGAESHIEGGEIFGALQHESQHLPTVHCSLQHFTATVFQKNEGSGGKDASENSLSKQLSFDHFNILIILGWYLSNDKL